MTGGKRSALGGTFFEPTVLIDVMTDMVITRGETFSPVAPLYHFKREDEAVKMATADFYSRDIGRIWRDIKERARLSLGVALVDRIS